MHWATCALISSRSSAMKGAYKEEVEACKLELDRAKVPLETWYAKRYPEKDIVGEIKDHFCFVMFFYREFFHRDKQIGIVLAMATS